MALVACEGLAAGWWQTQKSPSGEGLSVGWLAFWKEIHIREPVEHVAPVLAGVLWEVLASVAVSVSTGWVILTASALLLDLAGVEPYSVDRTGVAAIVASDCEGHCFLSWPVFPACYESRVSQGKRKVPPERDLSNVL